MSENPNPPTTVALTDDEKKKFGAFLDEWLADSSTDNNPTPTDPKPSSNAPTPTGTPTAPATQSEPRSQPSSVSPDDVAHRVLALLEQRDNARNSESRLKQVESELAELKKGIKPKRAWFSPLFD